MISSKQHATTKKQKNGSMLSGSVLTNQDCTDGEPHDEFYFERQYVEQSRLDALEQQVNELEELSNGIHDEWLNR